MGTASGAVHGNRQRRRRIWEQYGSRPCPIWMLMVGGGSGGKEINNGLKRSMEDSRNKHQSGNVREPHNRVDLELTNCLKRTKAVQERSCGPAVPRREHGGVGRPWCRRTAGGLLCRRPPPTAPRFCPSQTLRRLHERKTKTKRRRSGNGRCPAEAGRREPARGPRTVGGGAAAGRLARRGRGELGGRRAGEARQQQRGPHAVERRIDEPRRA